MKKQKGFTLIELLAIIVILAIIAVITVPIILNVIDNAKRGTAKDSAYGYKDAISKYYVSGMLEDESIKLSGDYNVVDGKLGEYDIPFSGTKPTSGYLTFENNALTSGCLTIDEYKVTFDKGEVTNVEVGECGPKVVYKCRRADLDTLHTEECTNSGVSCGSVGYTADNKGTTITYGNSNITEGVLKSGDAFDCDVNGDGRYESDTERFYYVSDLYNTTTKEFDSNYGVLIYYNNTTRGIPDSSVNSIVKYNDSGLRSDGPITAIQNLPTINDWKNISLINTTRNILTENGDTIISDVNYNSLLNFDYSIEKDGQNVKLAARLLTLYEVAAGCDFDVSDAINNPGGFTGDINNCLYLVENSKFIDYYNYGAGGLWFESVFSNSNSVSWTLSIYNSPPAVSVNGSDRTVRPVIEVSKEDIQY